MKRIALFILFIFTLVSFTESMVDISARNEKMSAIMVKIEKQTGAVFSYNPQLVDVEKKVTINIKGKNLNDAVAILFNKKYNYNIRGKYVIITSEIAVQPVYYAKNENSPQNKNEKIIQSDSGKQKDTCTNSIKHEIPLTSIAGDFKSIKIENYKNDTIMFKKFASIIALSALTTGVIDATPEPTPTPEPKAKKVKVRKERIHKERVMFQKRAAQLSFVYPMGTSGLKSPELDFKLSLNVLGGMTGDVNGMELSGIFNMNKQDVRGFQAASTFNLTEGNVKGVQASGTFNMVMEDVKGVQFSTLFNGAQVVRGVQTSGFFNYAQEASVQIAGLNIANDSSKVQIGAVNITDKGGFQLGIVNIRDTADGVSLGIINIVKNGGILDLGVVAGEFTGGGVYFKSGTKKLYAIVSFGHSFSKDLFNFGLGLGTTLYTGKKIDLNLEAINYNFYDNKFSTESYNGVAQIAPIFKYKFSNRIYGQVSPTFNLLTRGNSDKNNLEIDEPYSIWGNNRNDFWIGANAGIFIKLGK